MSIVYALNKSKHPVRYFTQLSTQHPEYTHTTRNLPSTRASQLPQDHLITFESMSDATAQQQNERETQPQYQNNDQQQYERSTRQDYANTQQQYSDNVQRQYGNNAQPQFANSQQQYGNGQQQYRDNNNSYSQAQTRGSGFMSGGGLLGIRGRRQDRRSDRRGGGGRQRGFGIISGIREAVTNRGGNGDQNQEGRSN